MSNPFAGGPQGPGQQPPYGQQPPQQPYGQPQQPYGQPQPNFYAGPPPVQPQQQRKPWLKWLRIGVPIVIIAIVAIVYFVGNKDDATKADVGDCLNSSKDVDDMKTVGCDASNAAFRVIEKFTDTSSTSKCETEELSAKGYVTSLRWTGSGKGVLCLTITSHTTLQDIHNVPGGSMFEQEDLDALREEFASQGVEGVK
ncbi:hypothetical protein LO772_18020 [Yinghuangia sp. ASG 101]|uniref:LppU/SCO3897 family protein n=1 Tax=Yinghuangia sp. ASG 101 TaxID=2896848 RepID=UPI001E2F4172|nr:hypothetical protein [Yinghuangia sp. ASG 101]UGQ08887.1 hypothetical protein LO772_18020 [Yinghuangia sp. ASG 101]